MDYSSQGQKRKKLATYLRTGSFKKIAGKKVFNRDTSRRRDFLIAVAAFIILTGLFFVIF